MIQNVLNVLYFGAWLLVALVVHEVAHALAAVRLGDHTPRSMGRLTLNPKAHVDPFGTLVLPAILLLPVLFGTVLFPPFAYAKPMPVNSWNLRGRDKGETWVALAGPAANVVLAFAVGALLRLTSTVGCGNQVAKLLIAGLAVNVIMAAIHLVPLPPFDGARIIVRFLPPRAREFYANAEGWAPVVVIVVFFVLAGPIFDFVDVVGGGIANLAAGASCLKL